ncbi:DHHW family protein [Desulfitobacterium hafniense]|uniref:DHHW family protein n=1 Tax=Desulfitobacterium hafniense TaxID=49338 RepID=UPI000373C155|nr:DHHW family protein [Desulfitobacterium hafniense]
MNNVRKKVFVLLFIMVLILPILTINRISGVMSKSENRYLAEFPQIFNADGELAEGLKNSTENWLNDNIGFRELFVKLYSNFNYHFLGRSPNERVEIGSEGWLYYTRDNNLKIAAGTYPLSLQDLEKIKNHQEKVQEYFNDQGIEYVLILPPSKVSIYPEFIRSGDYSVRNTPDDIVAEYLLQNSNIKVIKLKDDLLKAKSNEQVFFKTDTHWNESGAYIGYQTIIKELNRFGLTDSKPISVNMVPSTYKGEFAAMMGDQNLLKAEYTQESEIPLAKAQKITNGNVYDTIEKIKKKYNLKKPCYIYSNPSVQGKKVLMYGDSMFGVWNMPELLAENFPEFTYMWTYNIQQETIDTVKPDIVFYEIAERFIDQIHTKNIRLITSPMRNPKAEIVSHNTPTSISRKGTYTIDITIKNTGDESWSEEKMVRLCVFQDGESYRIYLPDGEEVRPGEEYTFVLSRFESPRRGNTTYLEYQMIEEGVRWFGEKERIDIMIE